MKASLTQGRIPVHRGGQGRGQSSAHEISICYLSELSLEKERLGVVSSLSLEELKHRLKTTSPGREESLWGAGGERGVLGKEREKPKEEAAVPKPVPLLAQDSNLCQEPSAHTPLCVPSPQPPGPILGSQPESGVLASALEHRGGEGPPRAPSRSFLAPSTHRERIPRALEPGRDPSL